MHSQKWVKNGISSKSNIQQWDIQRLEGIPSWKIASSQPQTLFWTLKCSKTNRDLQDSKSPFIVCTDQFHAQISSLWAVLGQRQMWGTCQWLLGSKFNPMISIHPKAQYAVNSCRMSVSRSGKCINYWLDYLIKISLLWPNPQKKLRQHVYLACCSNP